MSNIFTKPYKINFINGIVLVISGFTGYLLNPDKPETALIGPFFGVVFIIMTPLLRNKNKLVTYLLAFFTLLLFIMITKVLFKETLVIDRRTILLSLMSFSCLVSFLSFVISFVKHWKR